MTVGEFVAAHPLTAPLLEQLRIDFCCGGHRDLDLVLKESGLDPKTFLVLAETTARAQTPSSRGPSGENPATLPVPALVDYIVNKHHQYLRDHLPILKERALKVSLAHGDKDPGLRDLYSALCELAEELLEHLGQEEESLFPVLLRGGHPKVGLVGSLMEEHEDAGVLLVRIRIRAHDFAVPDWGCGTYRSLMEGLRALEEDLHLHIHLENNVLFSQYQDI